MEIRVNRMPGKPVSSTDQEPSVRRRAVVPKEQCPMVMAAELLGDRWMLLILREAFFGVQRYDDMREDLEAPRSMLTDRLAKLVEVGILAQRPYQEPGSRIRQAYELTEMGRALAPVFIAMSEWSETYLLGAKSPVAVVERKTKERLRVELVAGKRRIVNIKDAILVER